MHFFFFSAVSTIPKPQRPQIIKIQVRDPSRITSFPREDTVQFNSKLSRSVRTSFELETSWEIARFILNSKLSRSMHVSFWVGSLLEHSQFILSWDFLDRARSILAWVVPREGTIHVELGGFLRRNDSHPHTYLIELLPKRTFHPNLGDCLWKARLCVLVSGRTNSTLKPEALHCELETCTDNSHQVERPPTEGTI